MLVRPLVLALASQCAHAQELLAMASKVMKNPTATTAVAGVTVATTAPEGVTMAAAPAPATMRADFSKFCNEMAALYRSQKWGPTTCHSIPFEQFGTSAQGRPLVMFRADGAEVERRGPSSVANKLTVIQCGIHGDELPALPMCMLLIDEIMQGKRKVPALHRLVVQPLLNPDGMFVKKPTRQNAQGVDINRNFPTKDWEKDAATSWAQRDRKDPRKFPGHAANTESETRAVVDFIASEKPQKIISIHTPLGFLDLDAKGGEDQERRAKYLAINMVKNSGNYKFRKFGIYPGSLGNYAGKERHIPTYTLELPPGNTSRATIDSYWKKFRTGLWRAIDFDLDTGQFVED